MILSASTRCFSDVPFLQACEHLTDLQYDRVEIWMDEEGDHLKPSAVVANPEQFLTDFREASRLTPTAFEVANDLSSDDLEQLTKLAKLMRIAQITVPASPLGTPFNTEIDRLREYVALGTEAGVNISVATRTDTLTQDPHNAVELCQAVKGLGITLDPSDYITAKQPVEAYDMVYEYVFHVHLRDTSPDEFQVPVGLGEIDYSRIVSQLERYGYNRALSVKLHPELMDLSDRPLEMRKIRMLLETLL